MTDRLDLDDARALEAAAVARAARLRPALGGRQCLVLIAVLRLTTGWRKPTDRAPLAVIARLAFGLDDGAIVTPAQWRDTTDALLELDRRGVVWSKAPRGRPSANGSARYWLSADPDQKRPPEKRPPDGPITDDEKRPPDGPITDEKSARPPTRNTPAPRRETRPPDGRHSPELSPEWSPESSSRSARVLTSGATELDHRHPDDDDLLARFARRTPRRTDVGEIANLVGELAARHGHEAVRQALDHLTSCDPPDGPPKRYRSPRKLADDLDPIAGFYAVTNGPDPRHNGADPRTEDQ